MKSPVENLMSYSLLYVGELTAPTYVPTCLDRMNALKDLGQTVFPLDAMPYYLWGGKWIGGVCRKLKAGPPISGLNAAVLREARRTRPQVVWLDKAIWIRPGTLRTLKQELGCRLVHFTPDPAITFHRSRHFLSSIRLYDLIVTTKSYELDAYRALGARDLLFLQVAFDRDAHRPMAFENDTQRAAFASDVAFIGHWEPERERLLNEVRAVECRLAVWGPRWNEALARNAYLKAAHRGGALKGPDYARGWSGAKIGLCFLSKLAPDRTTTRSVEIPACGTFMLAERTEEHLSLFEEGKEAAFFGSAEEMLDKIRYYLKHDDERRRIADAGRERCLKSDYSQHGRMKEILHAVEAGKAGTRT